MSKRKARENPIDGVVRIMVETMDGFKAKAAFRDIIEVDASSWSPRLTDEEGDAGAKKKRMSDIKKELLTNHEDQFRNPTYMRELQEICDQLDKDSDGYKQLCDFMSMSLQQQESKWRTIKLGNEDLMKRFRSLKACKQCIYDFWDYELVTLANEVQHKKKEWERIDTNVYTRDVVELWIQNARLTIMNLPIKFDNLKMNKQLKQWEDVIYPGVVALQLITGRRVNEVRDAARLIPVKDAPYQVVVSGLFKDEPDAIIPLLMQSGPVIQAFSIVQNASLNGVKIAKQSTDDQRKAAAKIMFPGMLGPGHRINRLHTLSRGVYCIMGYAMRKINGFCPNAGPAMYFTKALAHVNEKNTAGYTDLVIEGVNVHTYTTDIE